MKNLFRAFGSQNNTASEQVDLNEQELESVNGAHGDDYCYEEEDDCYYYEEDDCDHHRHHHRHHERY